MDVSRAPRPLQDVALSEERDGRARNVREKAGNEGQALKGSAT